MKSEVREKLSVDSIEIHHESEIAAPIQIVFESVLDQLGPEGQMPGGMAFPMKLEARPGGRWYRDLGNDAGHLWGHVQVIKPPTLLEISGPLMVPGPAFNHLQYRLKAEGDMTRLTFWHKGIGNFPQDYMEGFSAGWAYWVGRIRELSESKQAREHSR